MTDRWLKIGTPVTGGLLLVSAYLVFVYAPQDALQGPPQRIFYMHLGAAMVTYLGYGFMVVGSIGYLWKRSQVMDRVARAGGAVALVFATVTIVAGSLWAKPVWGTWWTWDARLTSTLALWLVLAAYVSVRRMALPGQGARLAAVLALVGSLDIPVMHFSVQWWRTQHPGTVLYDRAGPQLPAEMLVALLVATVAMISLGLLLIRLRYLLEAARDLEAKAAEMAADQAAAGGLPASPEVQRI